MNIVRRFINVAAHDLSVAVCDVEHKLVSLFHVAPGATIIVEHAEEHDVHPDAGLIPAEGDQHYDADEHPPSSPAPAHAAALAQAQLDGKGAQAPSQAPVPAAAAADTSQSDDAH